MSEKRRKIWELYDLLSDREKLICAAWIEAHAGGAENKYVQLFRAMMLSSDDEEIWAKLYPTENYKSNEKKSDNRLRNLYHELAKFIEDYIAFQQFRKAPFLRDLFLIKGLNRRGLGESFRYFFRKVKQRWEKQAIRNSRYYWSLYELEGEGLHHEGKFSKKGNLDYFRKIEANLERALALEIKRAALIGENQPIKGSNVMKTGYIKALASLKINNQVGTKLSEVYEQLLAEKSEKDIDPVIKNIQHIWEERKDKNKGLNLAGDRSHYLNLAYLLVNQITKIYKKNKCLENRLRQYEFYVWMIDQELVFVDGYLPITHYTNVIYTGLNLERWEEVKEMIEKYAHFIPIKNREEVQSYARGLYYFYSKDYSKASLLLNRKYSLLSRDIQARLYLIQTYYELNNFESLNTELINLKKYLRRKQEMNEVNVDKYLLKLRFLEKLSKSETYEDYLLLKRQILSENNQMELDWIAKKCEENLAWLNLHPNK